MATRVTPPRIRLGAPAARHSPLRAPSTRSCGPRGCRRRTAPSAGWPRSNALSSSRSASTLVDHAATRWARSSATRHGGAGWRFSCEGGAAGGGWDSLPYAARYPSLRDAGLLPRYYRALEDEVAARATVLRDRVLKQRRDLYFAFRLAQTPPDWFTLGLLRGFGLPRRA